MAVDTVRAAIESSLTIDACAGQTIPRGLTGAVTRARDRIQSATTANPRMAHRIMVTAIRRLRAAAHRADVARRQGRISAACADATRSRLESAATQADCL
jgi:hypothetical protein